MESWIEAYGTATAAARENSIIFFRERDGERALRAYHTRDIRLECSGLPS